MKSLLALSRSVRLAVALILLVTVLSLLSTFVGFTHFFRSALFLVPVLLFALNLGSCASFRIVRRFREGERGRFGPDLVHLGLLVLIAGAIVTAFGRTEQFFEAAAGDQITLAPSMKLTVLKLESESYTNGAPRDWITTVEITKGEATPVSSYPIRVNHPLRAAGISVYQSSWNLEGRLDAVDTNGKPVRATTGQGFREGDALWLFSRVERSPGGWTAVFEKVRGREVVGEERLNTGGAIGPFRILGITGREVTGLSAVHDPGFPVVLAALVIGVLGLSLTVFQKAREANA